MTHTRREFIHAGAAAGAGLIFGPFAEAGQLPPADVTLRIGPVKLELAADHIVNTTGYNGTIPGCMFPQRLTERPRRGRPCCRHTSRVAIS